MAQQPKFFLYFFTALWAGIFVLLTTTSHASPYYVGSNPTPENTIFVSVKDAPTKKTAGRTDTGNVAMVEIQADRNFTGQFNGSVNVPMYMASANATGRGAETNIGNIGAVANWTNILSASTDPIRWGYSLALDGWGPSDRNTKSTIVSLVNPTVDYYRYLPFSTTVHPRATIFMSQNYFSAKTNVGYGYNYISRRSVAGNDQHRNTYTWQTAGTWHPLPFLNVNLEYNTIYLDSESAGGRSQFRHAVAPSISGDVGPVTAALHASFPIDAATRDQSAVALGLAAGLNF